MVNGTEPRNARFKKKPTRGVEEGTREPEEEESERLKSNTERSKREIDALREQNARLSRTLAQYQREGLELKREERSGTRSTVNPLENFGERERIIHRKF